jgi:hypothetical protein
VYVGEVEPKIKDLASGITFKDAFVTSNDVGFDVDVAKVASPL